MKLYSLHEHYLGFDGQGKTLTYSPAGLVTKVSDNGSSGSSPVDIDYHYYGDGKVKDVKVGGDNATLTAYTYDANRNPATVSDPSLGLLTYDYDGFGELAGSATPRDTSAYAYDALGRMTSRTGSDGTSVWAYDDGFLGAVSQTVYTPVSGSAVEETFSYDGLGRLTGQTQQVGTGETWSFGYAYDALGRRNTVTYPSGKRFKWHYDRNGFMDWVSDADKGTVVWQATSTDRWGNVTDFTEGNNHVLCDYDAVTGLVEGISARKDGQPVFGQACQWTDTGNLEWRTDTTLNLKETFAYDRFNRLETACTKNLAGTVTHATQGVEFDGKGNITGKDGVGGYAYGGTDPYAVTALGPDNAVAGILTDQSVAYTPFDKVASVTQDGKTLTVGYGIDRQRVTQSFIDGNITKTKRYFTPLYETVTENGSTEKIHYLTSASGLYAIFVKSSSSGTMHYTLKDHQGSLAAVVHGNTVERLSYDPWGRRRNTADFGYGNVSHTFDRGYTLHEHYDGFDLINMNGRLYDPILGRMLSPDVLIQDDRSSQAYNRYSYCFNNPLRFTDPSGYVVEDDWYVDKNGRIIWDDNVTSVSTTPEGGTYIGHDDKDILRFYGLREQYEKISKTRWGISLDGVMMEYDHNGNLYKNQSPWLVPSLLSDRVEGGLTVSVDVNYNTDEASGTNQHGRTFNGISFNFVLSQSTLSFNFSGHAGVYWDGEPKEHLLEQDKNVFYEIVGKKFTKTQIHISADNILTRNSFKRAQIRAGASNGYFMFGPRPIEMIWDLTAPIPIANQKDYTFKYYFLYEK